MASGGQSEHKTVKSLIADVAQRTLECEICYQVKKQVHLPCQHMLCEDCLGNIKSVAVSSTSCPFCRKELCEAVNYPICKLSVNLEEELENLTKALENYHYLDKNDVCSTLGCKGQKDFYCDVCFLTICYRCRFEKCAKSSDLHCATDLKDVLELSKGKYQCWKQIKEESISALTIKLEAFTRDFKSAVADSVDLKSLMTMINVAHKQQSHIQSMMKQLAEEKVVLAEYEEKVVGLSDVFFIRLIEQLAEGENRDIKPNNATARELMKLLGTIQVSNCSTSVCHYHRNTYIGLEYGTIAKIEDHKLDRSFITELGGPVHSITVCKDEMHILVYRGYFQVCVYDLAGHFIKEWGHADNISAVCKLTILSDHPVILDADKKELIIYSPAGDIVRHVPCHQISDSHTTVALCAVDRDSIIICDSDASAVFRMSVATSEVMWTCGAIADPCGVACYDQKHIFVIGRNRGVIHILNAESGHIVSEISDGALTEGVHDLYITDTTSIETPGGTETGKVMIVTTQGSEDVLFYQLI